MGTGLLMQTEQENKPLSPEINKGKKMNQEERDEIVNDTVKSIFFFILCSISFIAIGVLIGLGIGFAVWHK